MATTVSLIPLKSALISLQAALTPPPANDRERDGAIQRFEYTFELSWKTAKRALAQHGIEAQNPRDVIRELGSQSWISSVEEWFGYLDARNKTSHIYEEDCAIEVFEMAKLFAPACQNLLKTIEDRLS